MTLADLQPGDVCTVEHMGGARGFRRRLMELGLLPGVAVELVGIAPLGDPLELLVRGCSLSIRRNEALSVQVVPRANTSLEITPAPIGNLSANASCPRCTTPGCHVPATS
jgi:ferrous iron transport protein A